MKALFRISITLALLSVAFLIYSSYYDCGEPKTEVKQVNNSKRYRQETTITTPFRDWKGHCYARVEKIYSFSYHQTVNNYTERQVATFRTKPEPVILVTPWASTSTGEVGR